MALVWTETTTMVECHVLPWEYKTLTRFALALTNRALFSAHKVRNQCVEIRFSVERDWSGHSLLAGHGFTPETYMAGTRRLTRDGAYAEGVRNPPD
jgi:hypothetical protein